MLFTKSNINRAHNIDFIHVFNRVLKKLFVANIVVFKLNKLLILVPLLIRMKAAHINFLVLTEEFELYCKIIKLNIYISELLEDIVYLL